MRYTGKEYDEEEGINQHYFGARFLHETMLRFTSVDPRAEKYPGLSSYVYAAGNPLRNYDPDGEEYVIVSRNDLSKSINRMAKENLGIPNWIVDIMVPEKPELGIGPMAIESGLTKTILKEYRKILFESLKRIFRRDFGKLTATEVIKKGAFRGGAYSSLPGGPNIHRHHIPATSVSGLSRPKGPAIEMVNVEHMMTKSFGPGLEAQTYRLEIERLIEAGQMRTAVAIEIKDVREIAGTKYNEAIREMLDYMRQLGVLSE
jgi:RHS repeat-associated protein